MIFYLTEVQQKIGYEFKNPDLLRQCFTHGSYTSEFKNSKDNERLEFLGDSVLSTIVSDYLYKHAKQTEGKMTKVRSTFVCTENLSKLARLNICNYMEDNLCENCWDGFLKA